MWPFWIFSRSGIRAGPRNFGKWEQELCTLNISSSLCLKQKNTITVWNGTSSCRCLVYYFLLYSLLLRVVFFFFFSFPFKHSSSPSVVRPLSYSGLESQTCLSENHLLIRLPLHPWWFVFDGISPTGHQNKPEESEATQQPFFPFFWGGWWKGGRKWCIFTDLHHLWSSDCCHYTSWCTCKIPQTAPLLISIQTGLFISTCRHYECNFWFLCSVYAIQRDFIMQTRR